MPALPRILLVDDEPGLLRSLARLLRHDFDVTAVSCASAACELILAHPFDVVVADLALNDGSGPALYARLQRAGRGLEHRVVFMSGDVCSPEALAFTETVCNRVLEKPFDLSALREAVKRIVVTTSMSSHAA